MDFREIFILLSKILNILSFLLIARVLVSWVAPHQTHSRAMEILHDITEPFLRMARIFPHRIGMIDLSPLIALLMIDVVRYILLSL